MWFHVIIRLIEQLHVNYKSKNKSKSNVVPCRGKTGSTRQLGVSHTWLYVNRGDSGHCASVDHTVPVVNAVF